MTRHRESDRLTHPAPRALRHRGAVDRGEQHVITEVPTINPHETLRRMRTLHEQWNDPANTADSVDLAAAMFDHFALLDASLSTVGTELHRIVRALPHPTLPEAVKTGIDAIFRETGDPTTHRGPAVPPPDPESSNVAGTRGDHGERR
jgi:hypothetical protein